MIPAHNEAGEIDKPLQGFSSFDSVELVVAEDASTDGTPEIVQEFASRKRNVILTRSSTLAGKSGAIKRGLTAATGNVLGFIDAGRSIHPADFMRVVDPINCGADLAIGSRKFPASVILQHKALLSRILGAYAVLARALLQTTERDLQCGCKAFRRSVFEALRVNCDGFWLSIQSSWQEPTKGIFTRVKNIKPGYRIMNRRRLGLIVANKPWKATH